MRPSFVVLDVVALFALLLAVGLLGVVWLPLALFAVCVAIALWLARRHYRGRLDRANQR